jgi:heme ABC exporter ATP-binding subunit CcmA
MNQSIPLLSVCDIHKQFGYKPVLKGVSLDLLPGQSTLLVGKNGTGKSTLIKILAGLMRPTNGEVFFRQEKITEKAGAYRKAFGLITHNSMFYNDLSAEENLLFFGRLKKIPNLQDKVEEALAVTGLLNATGLAVKVFSTGMTKRLNIARLMITAPEILYLDEPYSGLDIESIDLLNAYLEKFKQDGGTILLISHQIDACYDFSDKVAFLANGIISREVDSKEFTRLELIAHFQQVD